MDLFHDFFQLTPLQQAFYAINVLMIVGLGASVGSFFTRNPLVMLAVFIGYAASIFFWVFPGEPDVLMDLLVPGYFLSVPMFLCGTFVVAVVIRDGFLEDLARIRDPLGRDELLLKRD